MEHRVLHMSVHCRAPPSRQERAPDLQPNQVIADFEEAAAAAICAVFGNDLTIQYNTKFVKHHVAVASEALANRTVKKHRRRRPNVL